MCIHLGWGYYLVWGYCFANKQTEAKQRHIFFQVGPCKMKGALSLVKAPPIFFENGSIEMESGNVSKSFIFPKTEAQNVQKLCPSRYLVK